MGPQQRRRIVPGPDRVQFIATEIGRFFATVPREGRLTGFPRRPDLFERHRLPAVLDS